MNPAEKSTAFSSLSWEYILEDFEPTGWPCLYAAGISIETVERATSAQKAASAEFRGVGSGEADARRF